MAAAKAQLAEELGQLEARRAEVLEMVANASIMDGDAAAALEKMGRALEWAQVERAVEQTVAQAREAAEVREADLRASRFSRSVAVLERRFFDARNEADAARAVRDETLCRAILTEAQTAWATTAQTRKRDRAASLLKTKLRWSPVMRMVGSLVSQPRDGGDAGSAVYVVLPSRRLISVSFDMRAALTTQDGSSMTELFEQLRRAVRSTLHRHRYYELAKELPRTGLRIEAVVRSMDAPFAIEEPRRVPSKLKAEALSRRPDATLLTLLEAEAVRVTLQIDDLDDFGGRIVPTSTG